MLGLQGLGLPCRVLQREVPHGTQWQWLLAGVPR